MSYYEALPIYRAAMDSVVAIDTAVRSFPRYHTYALGQRLRDASLDALVWVQATVPVCSKGAGAGR